MDVAQAPEVPGYDVGRLLGRGGSADVWLGTEQRTGRAYALKCFRTSGTGVPGPGVREEEVRREIRILSVLDHPHLIRAHDAVRVVAPRTGTALTMDYAAGGSLAQLVASRGRLSVGESVTVLTPIAQALGYLHGQGFTHSDVSPGNVLFTGQGKPMLSDVGVARMLGDPGGALTAGTAGFLDPSPVDAVRAGLQPERDVFSLAALGWYCLTGEVPGRTLDRPPLSLLVPGVPKELAAALEQGLNEDRRLRPTAMALGTAVYRSAAPLPLDLSGAVHPTVLPELLTRRNMPASSKGTALGTKLGSLRRRASTLRWSGPGSRARNRPFPITRAEAASHGKHAAGPVGTQASRIPRQTARVALPAVAVAAGIWWLSASGGAGPWRGEAAPGMPVDSAAHASSVPATSGHDGENGLAGVLGEARQQAAAADPLVAVRGLAALRDYALHTGSVELLSAVNAPGSPAAAADQDIAGQLGASGQRLDGFTTTVSDVTPESGSTQGRAVVRLTSASSGYQAMSAEDEVLAAGAASPAQRLRLVLVSVDGQWRISDILPGG
ncbi:protein kinase [Arthrobacter sp. SLBN-112]|uniref:protein kinase domain-containing protein n=1 Tax=Arthrobacter sp. SLBN-112 TaxID=2768452 RepID=UPI0027B08F31|nr:protein kinase [Arthrobacter sp. SLBN-112]MDQ0801609.1 serine/threonine protein kinase [Arthrobacter sp. SLBN-112]